MIIVENIVKAEIDKKPLKRDAVALDWENRQKSRQRLFTKAGRQIGLALPTGTILNLGDVLYRDAQVQIVVEGVPERVFVLRPETREEFGLMCHQIGNLHRPVGFQEELVLIPYEPVLENQLNRLGYAYTVEERIFTHAARQSYLPPHDH
ncbi:MAG: urease accessory protein UreE [Candidatus Poribacteria bacterium]|nr:urease accessory protein UreE [Candidatus Poribacteria bacterium]